MFNLKNIKWNEVGLFGAGVLFGTAGIWWSVPAAELVTLASSIYFIKKYIHKYEALRV